VFTKRRSALARTQTVAPVKCLVPSESLSPSELDERTRALARAGCDAARAYCQQRVRIIVREVQEQDARTNSD